MMVIASSLDPARLRVEQPVLEYIVALVRELDEEIHRLTEGGAEPADYDNVLDQAKSVETRFAVDHPVAERFLREIIDALSRVGI